MKHNIRTESKNTATSAVMTGPAEGGGGGGGGGGWGHRGRQNRSLMWKI